MFLRSHARELMYNMTCITHPRNRGQIGIKLGKTFYLPKVSKLSVEKGYLC